MNSDKHQKSWYHQARDQQQDEETAVYQEDRNFEEKQQKVQTMNSS